MSSNIWLLNDIVWERYSDRLEVYAYTKIPTHLSLRYSFSPAAPKTRFRVVRGYTRACGVTWSVPYYHSIDQAEDGLTHYHTFWLPKVMSCTHFYFYLKGSTGIGRSISQTPIFDAHFHLPDVCVWETWDAGLTDNYPWREASYLYDPAVVDDGALRVGASGIIIGHLLYTLTLGFEWGMPPLCDHVPYWASLDNRKGFLWPPDLAYFDVYILTGPGIQWTLRYYIAGWPYDGAPHYSEGYRADWLGYGLHLVPILDHWDDLSAWDPGPEPRDNPRVWGVRFWLERENWLGPWSASFLQHHVTLFNVAPEPL